MIYFGVWNYRKIGKLWFVAVFVCLIIFNIEYSQADPIRKILILNSYHKEFKWTDSQVSTAKKVLYDGIKDLELFVEYMDTKRIYNEEYIDHLRQIYELKYKKHHLDAIITTDDNALRFVVRYHKEIFHSAPVSFCGINDYKKELIEANSNITGVVEVLDIKPTIDLALKLHPITQNIVVVVDSTPTGAGQLNDIVGVARHYKNINFEYLEGKNVTHDELVSKLKSLPSTSLVLLAVWLRDKEGEYLSPHEFGDAIASISSVPVYGIIDMYLGNGIVGGKLLNSQAHGRIAAKNALQIINGKKPSDIPVMSASVNPYMFDYQELMRWRLPLSDLPPGSIVINKPYSFYEEYRKLIWGVFGSFAFLLAMVSLLIINIFRRKKAEESLRESKSHLRTLIDTIPDLIWLKDTNGAYLFCNARFESFFGKKEKDIIEKTDYNFMDIELADFFRSHDKIAIEAGRPVKNEETVTFAEDGHVEILETIKTPMRTIDGQIVGVLGIGRNISDRKQVEAERERLLLAIKQANEIVAITDAFGNMQFVNPAFEKITGFPVVEVIGHSPKILKSGHHDQKFYEDLWGTILSGEPWRGRIINKRKDGTLYTAECSISPVKDEKNKISNFVWISRDISRELDLEKRISQAQKMESIGVLAGGIAHDFNNLLFPIIGLTEIIMEDAPNGSLLHENAEEIFKAAMRARDLVKQILAFSRESEHKKIPVRLQKIIGEVVKLSRSTLPSDIDINHQTFGDCGLAMVDPSQIHQVLMNLITNAYHAVELTGGNISVQLKSIVLGGDEVFGNTLPPGPYAALSVSDTGHGIDPSVREKIFEPYVTTKKQGKGTGLGLSVVYGIVKGHNGDIKVYSEVGKGTTFNVYLPMIEKNSEPMVADSIEIYPTGRERILLVDDEEPIVRLERQLLERLGYHVTVRTSSIDALQVFKAKPFAFDLVISDMTMPNMTGVQLAKELISIRPDISVIICTGFSERISAKKTSIYGVKGFLMKPVSKSDMAKMVRQVLDRSDES